MDCAQTGIGEEKKTKTIKQTAGYRLKVLKIFIQSIIQGGLIVIAACLYIGYISYEICLFLIVWMAIGVVI